MTVFMFLSIHDPLQFADSNLWERLLQALVC